VTAQGTPRWPWLLLVLAAVLLIGSTSATATRAATTAPTAPSTSAVVTDPVATSSGDGAHRMIFWLPCGDVAALNDANLDRWKAKGVDGFVCMNRQLKGMGGTQDFTGDPTASLLGSNYSTQRSLRDSKIVDRARARGMKMYLGFYAVNYFNTQTPLRDWFDDAGWSQIVLPRVRDIAGAAKTLGFAGLATDQELYPQTGGARTASWRWNYKGNTRPEAEVRSMVRERGRQLMSTILGSLPNAEVLAYGTLFPESWEELVQQKVNGIRDKYVSLVYLELWDGISSVTGYRAIRMYNSVFYKETHIPGSTWDTALAYDYNRTYSLLSRRFSNWSYASSRFFISPFAWINSGISPWEQARSPAAVTQQLDAFRRWGTGQEFGLYAFRGLNGFDYSSYAAGMQAGSAPGVVDTRPPDLGITSPTATSTGSTSGKVVVSGTAVDNLAVRAVRWRDQLGGGGVATMTWQVTAGDYRSGWRWQMNWSTPSLTLRPGPNLITIRAEDSKGLATETTLTVAGPLLP